MARAFASKFFKLSALAGAGSYIAYPQIKTDTEFYFNKSNPLNAEILA